MIKVFTDKKLEEYVEKATKEQTQRMATMYVERKIDVIIEAVARELVGDHEFERIKDQSPWHYNMANQEFDELMDKAASNILKTSFFEQQVQLLEEKIKEPSVIKALVKSINEYQVKGA